MAASGTGVTLSPRARWLTLVAMTIANSMILVDQTAVPLATPDAVSGLGASLSSGQWILTANVLPLAALMVFGGRLGDQLGLRRIFLIGTALFTVSSFLAGAAPTFPFLIVMRLTQGVGAAMMMPTTMAIVSFVFPEKQRGRALGIMAGASAFFAALGPVLGGLITQFIDWRAVFWINVPLAIITGLITVACAPDIEPNASADRRIDYPGVFTFAIGIGLITFGLGQATAWGWASAATIGTVLVGVMSLVTFVFVERRSTAPLMQLRLFRHLNFTAANISQVLAGSVELATAFLPYFLLLVVGLSPGAAGIALIPMTIPIIVVAPLAGRWFDRVGGRTPLVVGFGVLAVSGLTLAYGAGAESAAALIPGLVLQGIGLGIVLTVNDPTGINAVPEDARGQASGVIDTSEQFGGAARDRRVDRALPAIHAPPLLRHHGRPRDPRHLRAGRPRAGRRHAGGAEGVRAHQAPAVLRRCRERVERRGRRRLPLRVRALRADRDRRRGRLVLPGATGGPHRGRRPAPHLQPPVALGVGHDRRRARDQSSADADAAWYSARTSS